MSNHSLISSMASEAKTCLLQTNGLTLGYHSPHSTVLFKDLQLSLYAGDLVCFMGPNGIGKSTLIRTLAGIQRPLSGTIELIPTSKDVQTPIAVVLTDRLNSNEMTVKELVTFGRYPYLDWTLRLDLADHQAIESSLELVNITHLSEKKLAQLSDGQMQMAMIALALAQDTPILLLDEPTSHLDLNNRLEVMNLLKKISRKTSKAILMATHELDLALQTADVIWLATLSQSIRAAMPEDLVLDGSFDEVFRFKGFDLKTGRVDHEVFQNKSIRITGQGHEYLWTKNALERNGYAINNKADIEVVIKGTPPLWVLSGNREFTTLFDLLSALNKL